MTLSYEKIEHCPGCRSRTRSLWTGNGNAPRAFRCKKCSLVYLGQRITDESSQEYYANYNAKRDSVKINLARKRKRMYEIDRNYVRLFLKKGKLLDVGSGPGSFLSGLPSVFERYAFDVDSSAIEVGKKLCPSIHFSSDLDKSMRRGPFDGIIFRGTLEYQRDLREVAKLCGANLRRGGYIILLSTTNSDSPLAELTREEWGLFQPIEHLCYFNLQSAKQLFRGMKLEHFGFPYIGTPYEDQQVDLRKFLDVCRGKRTEGRFPFWGSIMTCAFRKA